MRITRRHFCKSTLGAGVAFGIAHASQHPAFAAPAGRAATYLNPVLGGDHPDAGAIRVGQDFFLTHSSFDYAPGLPIWHSSDLVNWKLAGAALRKYYGSVWAPYLCEHEGRYYIYFPAHNELHVVHAPHPTGPWSEPISLHVSAIDPAHIAVDRHRYLHYNGGYMLELAPDGLSVKTPARKVVEPWPIPRDFRIECECLEAPKLFRRGDYIYLTVAEGGTGGPATSHMVVSARSKHPDGPWEYSPFNPIAHTSSRSDRWMSIGHGRLVDAPDGTWWMTLHSYENSFRSLGRQMLLFPIEWTRDGWFRVPAGVTPDKPIHAMASAARQQPPNYSDDFTSPELALHWQFWRDFDRSRFHTGEGRLELAARGTSPFDTSPLTCVIGGHSYTLEVDVECEPGCEAGLSLFYDQQHSCGIRISPQGIGIRLAGGYGPETGIKTNRATLRLVNDRQEVDFYYRLPGQDWKRTQESAEVSGMNHNVLGGFLSLRPALYACGSGKAVFRSFRHVSS
jgi:xylan 1,4-beta-xylosidase